MIVQLVKSKDLSKQVSEAVMSCCVRVHQDRILWKQEGECASV